MNKPEQIVGGLRLGELIGTGALANVFKAVDDDGEVVAVKIVPDVFRGDTTRAKRWERETAIVQTLVHENVISVRRVGYDHGYPFIVMEYVPGGTLGDLVDSRGHVSASQALQIVIDVGSGLAYLHSQNIQHRDIQPDNILLSGPARGSGRAIVADFSLAFRGDQSHFTSHNPGTLAFMAPEVLAGERSTPAADQYALAVIAFLALTGVMPFRNAGSQVLQPVPRLPRSVAVSPHVSDAIARAMAIDPADRFPTVREFRDALASDATAQILPSAKRLASAPVPEVSGRIRGPQLRPRHAPIVAIPPLLSAKVWLRPDDDLAQWRAELRVPASQTLQCMLNVANYGRTGARDVIARLLVPPHPTVGICSGSAFWSLGDEDADWVPIGDADNRITIPLVDRFPPSRELRLFCRLTVNLEPFLVADRATEAIQEFVIRGSAWDYQTSSIVDAEAACVRLSRSDAVATSTPLPRI